MSATLNLPTICLSPLPLPLTNYSMNEYEIITDPQVIEEAFRQDQEAEDAPVPDKVQDILTNTV